MLVEISEDGFINMLLQQNGGALVEELDRELINGVGAIFDHGGDSTLTLKIKTNRIKEFDNVVNITHDVTVKHPKEQRPKKAMFITQGNGLTDQAQKQETMDLGTPVTSKPTALFAKSDDDRKPTLKPAGAA